MILPKDQRQAIKGVLFEVHHAPSNFQHLVGRLRNLAPSDGAGADIRPGSD